MRTLSPSIRGTVWRKMHMIDLVALPLGTALTLRFWQGLLGVHDSVFIAIWTTAALCEMTRRAVDARRDRQRPTIFCAERRLDFAAAALLGVGPWPIAAAVNDQSPLGWMWRSLPIPGWLGLAVAVAVLGFAAHRLAVTVGQPPRASSFRRIRDLVGVPDLHMATLAVLPDGAAASPRR